MEDNDNPKKEEVYCEWCGDELAYISIYENEDYENEVFICKDCYEQMYE